MPGKHVAPAGHKYQFNGARLRLERKRRGLSLEKLATLIGVTRSMLALIERGKRKPSLETFERLLRIFDERPESILKAAAAGNDVPLDKSIAIVLKGEPKDRRESILRSLQPILRRASRAKVR